MSLSQLKKDLRAAANPEQAKNLSWFFKTGPGEYGEGDIFIGLRMSDIRRLGKQNRDLPLADVGRLLDDKIHEFRTTGIVILAEKFKRGDAMERTAVKNLYETKMNRVNNWDLVDLSAHKVFGEWYRLMGKNPLPTLRRLAKSRNLWRRRIAIIATFAYIRFGEFKYSLEIAEMLLHDKHDLIHKAVGWMLREIGKIDLPSEEQFLLKHYKKMPRTMLRYAIEKFPEPKRQKYLKGVM